MRVEFKRGVPKGCIEWLWENVGPGNLRIEPGPWHRWHKEETDAWFYEREKIEIRSTDPSKDSNIKYVNTITFKDPELATLFVLRWA